MRLDAMDGRGAVELDASNEHNLPQTARKRLLQVSLEAGVPWFAKPGTLGAYGKIGPRDWRNLIGEAGEAASREGPIKDNNVRAFYIRVLSMCPPEIRQQFPDSEIFGDADSNEPRNHKSTGRNRGPVSTTRGLDRVADDGVYRSAREFNFKRPRKIIKVGKIAYVAPIGDQDFLGDPTTLPTTRDLQDQEKFKAIGDLREKLGIRFEEFVGKILSGELKVQAFQLSGYLVVRLEDFEMVREFYTSFVASNPNVVHRLFNNRSYS